jgi:serine/threonine-protein kinase
VTIGLQDQLQSALGSSYTVERELGGGGMSRVFVAEERRLARRVVVKVLSPELAADVSTERFEREIRVAAKLQDPRIVPVLSAGEAGGLPFYTMPFIDGTSLRARIKEGPVPLANAISILRDIALALEYAHEHGIVHRDIKPENVLLTTRARGTRGDGAVSGDARVGTAVVTDFGISKALVAAGTGSRQRDGAGDLTLTQAGVTLGTPAYMAPEQAAGDAVDHRADLYAWGIVAYELLAGMHPFSDRTTAGGLVAAHIRDTPPALATRLPAVPTALASVVDQALAKDPSRRPASASEIVAALDAAERSSGGRREGWLRRVAVGVIAIAAVSLAIVMARRSMSAAGEPRGARSPAQSIAVLPFANQSADTGDVFFAEGMSDELTTALGRLASVRVASRSSAARFRDSSALAAGRALKVDAVLEGKVRRYGDNLQISASLTSANDGTELWSQTFRRRAADVFDVQDEIAHTIVDSLRFTLTGRAPVTAAAPRGTKDLDAYQLYLRGRYAWSRRGTDLLSAVRFYKEAIHRDTSFARAYAGLAMAYTPMMVFGVARGDSVLPLAEASAVRALALDSTLAEAHLALASVRKMQWRWKDAERQFRAAIEYSPGDATAHQWYGTLLYSLGRVDDAVNHLLHARDLDPVNAALGTDVTYGLYAAHQYSAALDEGRRTVSLDSTLAISHWLTGLALLALGRPDTALVALTTSARLGNTPDARPALVSVYRALGRTHDADTTYASLARAYRSPNGVARDMAVGAAAMGDLPTAMAAIKRTIERRDPIVTEYSLPCDPLLDPLKALPEFGRMLTKAGMQVCPPAR